MALFPTHIIIVAGGSGSRFGADIPKQFCPMHGRPVLMHTIDAMRAALPGSGITLVLSPAHRTLWEELCCQHDFDSPAIAEGGSTRWESVRNGLAALPSDTPAGTIVLIHDGARPLADSAMVRRVAAAALNTDGAIPAIPVADSLRRMEKDGVRSEPVDRADFRAIQTPQAFTLWRLREAYSLPYQPDFTDDASVLAAAGFHNIILVDGSPDNIKITNPRDIAIAEALASHSNP